MIAENAHLRARLEFVDRLVSQREEYVQELMESRLENAVLQTRLQAVESHQEIVDEMIELVAENARLEATVEMQEWASEVHASIYEEREEMLEGLYELVAENARLEASVQAGNGGAIGAPKIFNENGPIAGIPTGDVTDLVEALRESQAENQDLKDWIVALEQKIDKLAEANEKAESAIQR